MSSMQSLENTILRLGDQSGIYSDEEEQAISAIYDKIDSNCVSFFHHLYRVYYTQPGLFDFSRSRFTKLEKIYAQEHCDCGTSHIQNGC